MNIQEAIRLRIIELANEKNLSMNKIAERCYMNTSTLISLLNGHSKRSEVTTIAKICYGLGVTVKEFYNSPLFDDINYLD